MIKNTRTTYNNGDIIRVKKRLPASMSHFRKDCYGIIEHVDCEKDNPYDICSGKKFFIRFLDGESSGWYTSDNVIDLKISIDKVMKYDLKTLIDITKLYIKAQEDVRTSFYKLLDANKKSNN